MYVDILKYPHEMDISALKKEDGVTTYLDSASNGSMRLEVNGSVINVPNGYGDGDFDIVIVNDEVSTKIDGSFFTSVEGKFTVKEVQEKSSRKLTDIELEGTYFIYRYSPDQHNINVILVKRS